MAKGMHGLFMDALRPAETETLELYGVFCALEIRLSHTDDTDRPHEGITKDVNHELFYRKRQP